jgi:glutaredoxin
MLMAARSCCCWITVALALSALGCAGDDEHLAEIAAEGEPVEPPFEVRGEAEGLLLVWFDDEGLHTASRRSEIPEEHRDAVRVDDLELAPDERLDPDLVSVADLRRPAAGGSYAVRRMRRTAFDARVERAAPRESEATAATGTEQPDGDPAATSSDVIIYGASWCGACRSTAAFLRERGIEFVERDIEREPGAREAMQRAARAAGVSPSGIPVIDFRGRVIQGFDRGALERAIADTTTAI